MRYFRIEFSNGYAGCDDVKYMTFDSLEEAENYAEDNLEEFGLEYEHIETGWDNDWESEEDREAYYSSLEYEVEEITREDYEEEN